MWKGEEKKEYPARSRSSRLGSLSPVVGGRGGDGGHGANSGRALTGEEEGEGEGEGSRVGVDGDGGREGDEENEKGEGELLQERVASRERLRIREE